MKVSKVLMALSLGFLISGAAVADVTTASDAFKRMSSKPDYIKARLGYNLGVDVGWMLKNNLAIEAGAGLYAWPFGLDVNVGPRYIHAINDKWEVSVKGALHLGMSVAGSSYAGTTSVGAAFRAGVTASVAGAYKINKKYAVGLEAGGGYGLGVYSATASNGSATATTSGVYGTPFYHGNIYFQYNF